MPTLPKEIRQHIVKLAGGNRIRILNESIRQVEQKIRHLQVQVRILMGPNYKDAQRHANVRSEVNRLNEKMIKLRKNKWRMEAEIKRLR